MTLEVRFEAEAASGLLEAARRYEQQRIGLGVEFLDAFDRGLALIQRWPEAAPLAADVPLDLNVRRAPVERFPYRVVYLQTATAIRVLAVAHEARRPGYWNERVRETGATEG